MVLLSVIFFGIASLNLGSADAPISNWQSTTNQNFTLDLGSQQQVQTVYFWVKSGNASVTISSGSPQEWFYVGEYKLQDRPTDYWVWQDITVNVNTRYLDFNVTPTNFDSRPDFYWSVPNPTDREPYPFVEISEIGVSDVSNRQIQIADITGQDATLTKLVDEQGSLEFPPTYMTKMYFDEVYFSRSAIELSNGETPDERTHPPLGKLIQAVGVEIFGPTPFGWRIMGVLFGMLIVPLMYLLGKKLFGTWIGGFSAAFLMTFDFMHFTMARIGTTDTYVVFFSLISQIFFLVYFMNVLKDGWKQTSVLPLFLAVVFFALGISVKWFTIWGAVGLVALLVAIRFKDLARLKGSLADKYVAFFNYPFLLLLGFVGVAAAVYFATYIPEMLAGNSFLDIANLQLSMYTFHSGPVDDPTGSPWWSWPFMFRLDGVEVPRWFDISYFPPQNTTVSTITVFGNPMVWWLGFALVLALTWQALHLEAIATNLRSRISKSAGELRVIIKGKGWDIPAIYIVVVFFFSWLPYVVVGRATYIYHFYLSVPLLCLAIAYVINRYWHLRLGKVATVAVFAVTVALFVLFYPVISGAPVASTYIHDYLKWFPSWYFAP